MTGKNASEASDPIAVADLDCLYAGAPDLAAFWEVVSAARPQFSTLPDSLIHPDVNWDPSGKDPARCITRQGAFFPAIPVNLLKLGIPPKTAEATDRSQLEPLFLADRLLDRLGLGPKASFDRTRARIALGCGLVAPLMERYGARLERERLIYRLRRLPVFATLDPAAREAIAGGLEDPGAPPFTPDSSLGFATFRGAGRLANRLDFRGGYTALSTACAGSLIAIGEACRWLRQRECDLVLAGGTDYSMMTTLGLTLFSAAQAMTPDECRPFDRSANGTLGGIGCGLVVLMRLSDARRAGLPVRARLLGAGMSSDGRGAAITQPTLDGIIRAVESALAEAGVPLASLSYLETHGTGTPLGDDVELKAMDRLIETHGGPAAGLALGAHKQLIGHTHAAAGVAGLIKTILAMEKRVIPPLPHIRDPRPPLTPDSGRLYYIREPREWPAGGPRRALVSAFGFGGINSCLVVEENR